MEFTNFNIKFCKNWNLSLIDGFILLIKQHITVFYLGVEMPLIDRAYLCEHFDIHLEIFGMVKHLLCIYKIHAMF